MTLANGRLILRAAAPTGGVVLRQTLLGLGVTYRAISSRLSNGELRRDRVAAAHGYLVLRVMWDEVVNRPTATFAEIADTVERRRLRRSA